METSELFSELNQKLDKIIDLLKSAEQICKEGAPFLYANADVQKKLGVSSSTLQKYRSTGMIGFIQKGKKIYYTQKHIDDFLSKDFDSEWVLILNLAYHF